MIMRLTQRLSRVKIVTAVAGLCLIVIYAVILAAFFGGSRFVRSPVAEMGPVFYSKNIVIRDSRIDNNVRFPSGKGTELLSTQEKFVRLRCSCPRFFCIHSGFHVSWVRGIENSTRGVAVIRVGVIEHSFPVYREYLDDRFTDIIQRWRLTSVKHVYLSFDGVSGPSSQGLGTCELYPSALILAHLPLEYLHTALSSFRLLICNRELLFNSLGGLDGISRSLLRLVIQDFRLALHLHKLAMEDPSRINTYSKQKNSDPYHVPIGILEPWIGGLWLGIGLALDGIAMWLLRIRSMASNSGREWCACIGLGFLILGISVFPIVHGTDLILGF